MRSRRLALSAGLLAGLAAAMAQPAALGAGDAVPVTSGDDVTVLVGGGDWARVLRNDSDDSDDLQVCRVAASSHLAVGVRRGRIAVTPLEDTPPGDYRVRYQACDTSYLVPAVLTVHVAAAQEPTVEKVADRPGVLSVTNPNPVPVEVAWGGLWKPSFDDQVRVSAGAEKEITVSRHRVRWIAFGPSIGFDPLFLGSGEVTGIPLPDDPSPRAGAHGAPRPRLLGPGPASAEPTAPGAAGGWPADPTTVQPPVTHRDVIRWWSGSHGPVPVTANDTDPQGQRLTVCRIGEDDVVPGSPYTPATPRVVHGRLRIDVVLNRAGATDVTYYACNDGRLAAGHLRVKVRKARHLVVTKVRPGVIRVANPNPALARIWIVDTATQDRRRARIPAHHDIQLKGSWSSLVWGGSIGAHHGYAGKGWLTGVQ